MSTLSQLKVGERAVLVALNLPEPVQNHLMHMGFIPEATVAVLRRAPAGDPTVYLVDSVEIALRHETAEAIAVRPSSPGNHPSAASVRPSPAGSFANSREDNAVLRLARLSRRGGRQRPIPEARA